jgi:hypothetical protein
MHHSEARNVGRKYWILALSHAHTNTPITPNFQWSAACVCQLRTPKPSTFLLPLLTHSLTFTSLSLASFEAITNSQNSTLCWRNMVWVITLCSSYYNDIQKLSWDLLCFALLVDSISSFKFYSTFWTNLTLKNCPSILALQL